MDECKDFPIHFQAHQSSTVDRVGKGDESKGDEHAGERERERERSEGDTAIAYLLSLFPSLRSI